MKRLMSTQSQFHQQKEVILSWGNRLMNVNFPLVLWHGLNLEILHVERNLLQAAMCRDSGQWIESRTSNIAVRVTSKHAIMNEIWRNNAVLWIVNISSCQFRKSVGSVQYKIHGNFKPILNTYNLPYLLVISLGLWQIFNSIFL